MDRLGENQFIDIAATSSTGGDTSLHVLASADLPSNSFHPTDQEDLATFKTYLKVANEETNQFQAQPSESITLDEQPSIISSKSTTKADGLTPNDVGSNNSIMPDRTINNGRQIKASSTSNSIGVTPEPELLNASVDPSDSGEEVFVKTDFKTKTRLGQTERPHSVNDQNLSVAGMVAADQSKIITNDAQITEKHHIGTNYTSPLSQEVKYAPLTPSHSQNRSSEQISDKGAKASYSVDKVEISRELRDSGNHSISSSSDKPYNSSSSVQAALSQPLSDFSPIDADPAGVRAQVSDSQLSLSKKTNLGGESEHLQIQPQTSRVRLSESDLEQVLNGQQSADRNGNATSSSIDVIQSSKIGNKLDIPFSVRTEQKASFAPTEKLVHTGVEKLFAAGIENESEVTNRVDRNMTTDIRHTLGSQLTEKTGNTPYFSAFGNQYSDKGMEKAIPINSISRNGVTDTMPNGSVMAIQEKQVNSVQAKQSSSMDTIDVRKMLTEGAVSALTNQPEKPIGTVAANSEKILNANEGKTTEPNNHDTKNVVLTTKAMAVSNKILKNHPATEFQSVQSTDSVTEPGRSSPMPLETNAAISSRDNISSNIEQYKHQAQIDTTRLTSHIKMMKEEGIKTALLQLKPDTLGALNIQLSVEGDSLSVNLVATQAVAKEALESSILRLKDSLSELGVNVSVSLDGGRDKSNTGGHSKELQSRVSEEPSKHLDSLEENQGLDRAHYISDSVIDAYV